MLGGFWLEGHGLSVGSEALGLSSRVRRAAPSLQMQTDGPAEASYGAPKTATLAMPPRRGAEVGERDRLEVGGREELLWDEADAVLGAHDPPAARRGELLEDLDAQPLR
tara:strand:+ start:186 stop:512 length:327 start_codon:yes stop_codon:yes gene_type:complete